MRAERAGSAIDLAEIFLSLDLVQLAVQTVHVHRKLLAQRSWGSRLAMGQRQHGLVAVFLGLLSQMVEDGLRARQPHVLDAVLHATGNGQVVDVFGCAGEMHQGLESGQLGFMTEHVGGLVKLIVDVIFHGLHVMMGFGLMSSMLSDAFSAEILRNGAQERLLLIGKRLDARNDGLVSVAFKTVGKQNHPFDFHTHALAVQCRFAQIFDKRSGLPMVAAVKRGQCDCRGNISKLHRQQHTFSRKRDSDICPFGG